MIVGLVFTQYIQRFVNMIKIIQLDSEIVTRSFDRGTRLEAGFRILSRIKSFAIFARSYWNSEHFLM